MKLKLISDDDVKRLENKCRRKLRNHGYRLCKLRNNKGYFIADASNVIVLGGDFPQSLSLEDVVTHVDALPW
jgi:hypothetical protein